MTQYVFDTNIFVNLQRRQPIDIYPSVWDKIGELMKNGTVISSMEVYDEISVGGDALVAWAKAHQAFFLPSQINIQQKARVILQDHRGLIEGGKKKNSADPFVIALAQEKRCPVVTEETRTRSKDSPKIPDVCDVYNIDCIDFVGFSRQLKLAF